MQQKEDEQKERLGPADAQGPELWSHQWEQGQNDIKSAEALSKWLKCHESKG